MKTGLHTLFFWFVPLMAFSQEITFTTGLDPLVEETSGLVYLDNRIITHNDSGDEPVLYEIDSISGSVIRRVWVENAVNTDWEDICSDDVYIYIGDIGNNSGDRRDLKIYKVKINDYLFAKNDTVMADTIMFSYVNQADYTPAYQETDFDAEALISYGDSLYIFSKNWVTYETDIYPLPKKPGKYQLQRTGGFDVGGLITGGCCNPYSGKILLCGYTLIFPFVIELSDFEGENFSTGRIEKTMVQSGPGNSVQLEAIVCAGSDRYWLSTEKSITGSSSLHLYETKSNSTGMIISHDKRFIFPNPADEYFYCNLENITSVHIFSVNGKLMKTAGNGEIDISDLTRGIYQVSIMNAEDKIIHSQLLCVE